MIKFITFEGGEGAGKSTQIQLLKEHIAATTGEQVVLTREPGGTQEGERIRELMLNVQAYTTWDPLAELLLINAARRQHLTRLVVPALNEGAWVLCDRFIDSTLVYQGMLKGINPQIIRELHETTCFNLMPSLTFYIDVDPKMGIDRILRRSQQIDHEENIYDKAKMSVHEKIRDSYVKVAQATPKRIMQIDGAQNLNDVAKDIRAHFKKVCDN